MTNFNFSDIIEWDALSEAERTDILRRPAVMAGDKITAVVSGILDEVESRGDAALRDFSAKFDRTEVKNFKVSKAEVDAAISRLSPEFIKALQTAAKNIEKFHSAEVLETVTVETCRRRLSAGYSPDRRRRPLYSGRHGTALFHSADAWHSGQDRRLRPRHPLLAASDCRSDSRSGSSVRH